MSYPTMCLGMLWTDSQSSEVLVTWDLDGHLTWGQSCRTEIVNLWSLMPTPGSVRTELNCETPSWC